MSEKKVKFGFIKSKYFATAVLVISAVVAGTVILWFGKFRTDDEFAQQAATFAVIRGPLAISVTESGTIKPRDQVILKNEVEGRTSIITLVPEGTRVKKGDLLVELDVSSLLDNRIDQEIRVQNAEASYIDANENFAVVENQAESDKDKAHLTLEFAKQDLQKYLEGEYPNQLREAEGKITLAREELARAEETLKWSKTLFGEKYISQTELQADQLNQQKRDLDVKLAESNLALLKDFTYRRNLAQLESDVHQAEMALERTTRKAKANVIQAEADLKAKQAEYRRQEDKLTKIEDQIQKAKIYAPVDGLVIYATSAERGGFRGNIQPLDEGQEVRERQELIYLPTAASAKAEVDIHESSLQRIRPGLPAIITVDALPGKKFYGKVAHIAPLPDAQSMWMNPDLKVYNTDIYLDNNDDSLRTGMSCQAEIIIERYDDAVYVPVQAVLRVGGETTVYVSNGKMLEPRKVEIGLDNNRMIRIISGLKEGEIVSLTPPLKSAGVEPYAGIELAERTPVEEKMFEGESMEQAATQKSWDQANPAEQTDRRRERFRNMSPEEREAMRQRLESMSPEEREKMRERPMNMSPEERQRPQAGEQRGDSRRGAKDE
ncbi:MAG TPA: efflux RND transporter periplasmic adaptor subunit [Sedimentisphaerales bacterium]|nr:efflux RND transporter periplasmic adaptor subunit [Sedimentisphaerales bacterium]